MSTNLNRRQMLKMGMTALTCAAAGNLLNTSLAHGEAMNNEVVKVGIITDMHKTTKSDTATRKYSASLDKMKVFIENMEKVKPAFIIELGDFVDMLSAGTDPVTNLKEIDNVFTSYSGPAYHVLGNHEFDNVTREEFLKTISNPNVPQGQTWYSWDSHGIHFIVLDADYTPNGFRPYDMNTPEDTFWSWTDTIIPPQEIKWLENDLKKNTLPVIVFSHQTLDRLDTNDHNIKNASQVRALLEKSKNVLAVISGHDHQGGYSNIKGIHYVVLPGNVGVQDSRPWSETSEYDGLDKVMDNQFVVLTIAKENNSLYKLSFDAAGRQASYILDRPLA